MPDAHTASQHPHRPFTLVLAGGGARGYAHVGVLRALAQEGWRPHAIVGVSMGALVGATYALRDDWYEALLRMDTTAFPDPFPTSHDFRRGWRPRIEAMWHVVRSLVTMGTGWGVGEPCQAAGMRVLQDVTNDRDLSDSRLPLAICASDLRSGQRVVFREGNAAERVYASVAIPGVLPPYALNDRQLVDGIFTDSAPVDLARTFDPSVVIAVDPTQTLAPTSVCNGFQAALRAVEICQMRLSEIRFEQADCVLRARFSRTIDTLDFSMRRECIAAGAFAVRQQREELRHLLRASVSPSAPAPLSSARAHG
ncbi:patatin-like phospholipase family protein [Salisaeta longa]|uniref:patatin-like phospholipase family protein n=1 Tax=Salisaeta longa TaxID=503170 RepID=UPI0003B350EA|nr:patatin-like phospholipase family protein [Salisaeta longa]